jgi:hypothetical protein
MNLQLSETSELGKITTLVDYSRRGRYILAYCPVCDHCEEARVVDDDQHGAEAASIQQVRLHIRRRHRSYLA